MSTNGHAVLGMDAASTVRSPSTVLDGVRHANR
jgi:hypothetical protein